MTKFTLSILLTILAFQAFALEENHEFNCVSEQYELISFMSGNNLNEYDRQKIYSEISSKSPAPEDCKRLVVETTLVHLDIKFQEVKEDFSTNWNTETLEQKINNYNQMIENSVAKFAPYLNQLEILFPDKKGDLKGLLESYEGLVLQTRTNLSPDLSDKIISFERTAIYKDLIYTSNKTQNFLNPNFDPKAYFTDPEERIAYNFFELLYPEFYSECLFEDEVHESEVCVNQKASLEKILDINRENKIFSPEGLYEFNMKAKEINQRYNNGINEELLIYRPSDAFIELNKNFKIHLKNGNGPGSTSTFSSASINIPGFGASGKGRVIQSGKNIILCYEDDCINSQHLAGNYYWAVFNGKKLIIEKVSLKVAAIADELLIQLIKDRECFDKEVSDYQEVKPSNVDIAKACGAAVVGTIATTSLGLGESIVGIFNSIYKRENQLDYSLTKATLKKSQEFTAKPLIDALDRNDIARENFMKQQRKDQSQRASSQLSTISKEAIVLLSKTIERSLKGSGKYKNKKCSETLKDINQYITGTLFQNK